MTTTITHMVPTGGSAWHHSYPPAFGFTTRNETLKKYAVQTVVTREAMQDGNAPGYVEQMLRERLDRDVTAAGRWVHGEVTISMQEDMLRDAYLLRAECLTRERTDGQWPSLHQALREDEEDRREALRPVD
jgi:hypothetical protein